MTTDEIIAKLEAEETVVDGVVTLLNTLTGLIKDAGTDPVKLERISALIDEQKQKLADAIVANTPAAVVTTSEPPTP